MASVVLRAIRHKGALLLLFYTEIAIFQYSRYGKQYFTFNSAEGAHALSTVLNHGCVHVSIGFRQSQGRSDDIKYLSSRDSEVLIKEKTL